ncbi:amidase 1 [Momordica charantia]|uniref:Amidase 1 n=1 Tax=Momordica charantia TaxID=3673 RepID=A0A6J1DR29_MOMCH|nr:amidase 1 [Momordica charantia]XP_022156710.1 amidase 1 [Momordica charantia]
MAVQDHGAFVEKFLLQPSSPSDELPLAGLTFAVKDIFDMDGYVTGFGNPEWARTHPPANQTAPTVSTILRGGATCIGRTVMDEMAYSINGENIHYGTPQNPYALDRIPGGSSSGSAVAVGAKLVDFSLGTDTGGSIRVPASYCGILGFRPSHGAVSTSGVIPMSQSFDTVGWFARDLAVFKRVGRLLLQQSEVELIRPTQVLIAEDCFKLSSIPSKRLTQAFVNSVKKLFGGHLIKEISLGNYVDERVPSLKHFMIEENAAHKHSIPSLAALARSMQLLQRYEFKTNHEEWIRTCNPHFGPGISERISDAMKTTDENTDLSRSIKTELREALAALLEDFGVLAIPTVPGPPPKLNTNISELHDFRSKAFSLLSIAGVSGFCQVNIPLGLYNGLPVSISLLAKHGADGFLLNVVETIYNTLKEEVSC